MRQGQSAVVSARLSRGIDVNITKNLDGNLVIESTQVSCLVSLVLSSEEEGAFTIANIPEGRKDEQVLRADHFAQWDWRITPQKSGVLHLLLYVTPMLYIDGVGQGVDQIPQPPRVITVSPDYAYAIRKWCSTNWVIIVFLLSAIFIPLTVWLYGKFTDARKASKEKQKHVGFVP